MNPRNLLTIIGALCLAIGPVLMHHVDSKDVYLMGEVLFAIGPILMGTRALMSAGESSDETNVPRPKPPVLPVQTPAPTNSADTVRMPSNRLYARTGAVNLETLWGFAWVCLVCLGYWLAGTCAFTACVTDPVTGKKHFSMAQAEADWQNFQANPIVQAAEKEAEAIAFNVGMNLIQAEANGQPLNGQWMTATALNSISAVARQQSNSQTAQTIVATVQNFTDDPGTKPAAQKLAQAFLKANPQSPAEKQATIVALATGVSNGTTAAEAASAP